MNGELKKLEKQMGQMGKEMPSVMSAFMKLDQGMRKRWHS